jgi:CRISPR-associated protein Cmr2
MAFDRNRPRDGRGDGKQQSREPLRQTLPESYDLYARYPTETEDDIRRIVGNHPKAYRELQSVHTRVSLLTTSLVEKTKEFAKSGDRKFGGGYPSLMHEKQGINAYTKEVIRPALVQMEAMGLYPPNIDIELLPPFSFHIQMRFILTRPFYSRDDELFYIHENAVMKDSVFKIPMVRATSWKGTLRSNATKVAQKWPKLVDNLFGYARGEDNDDDLGQRSRLIFYPTFFDAIDLDMMNPHSRKTKAGTVPISLEIVPAGATGYFTLTYVPFNLIGLDEKAARTSVAGDLLIVAQTIERTMCRFGFSAKRNRGFGLVDQQLADLSGAKPGGRFQMKNEAYFTFRSFGELKKIATQHVNKLTKRG